MTRTLTGTAPTYCTVCTVDLAGLESRIAGWAGGGLTYWCHDCDPRKEHA